MVHVDEAAKKLFNPYRFLVFPWGVALCGGAWYGFSKGLFALLKNCEISHPSWVPLWITWGRLELFFVVIGILAIFLFLFLYPRFLPMGDKSRQNIYILISPENFDDDKYITEDFVNDFSKYTNNIDNIKIIVPNLLKRREFNRKVKSYRKKSGDFWKSKDWQRLHRKLHGALYLSGALTSRTSNQKEHFVFSLVGTISYADFNKELTPVLLQELNANFPSNILIDKSFEFEQFNSFSECFATLAQYLIGFSHLVSGHIPIAYRMHKDIFDNNKQAIAKKGMFSDITQVLKIELESIMKECKKFPTDFIKTCAQEMQTMFPDDSSTLLAVSRSIVMISNETEILENANIALKLLQKARINKDNRATVHANRAYLNLLIGDYEKAEKEYEIFFKYSNQQIAANIVEYCDEQISSGTQYEKPTAYYVRAIMMSRSKSAPEAIMSAHAEAKKNIPSSFDYYHKKLDCIQTDFCKKGKSKKAS